MPAIAHLAFRRKVFGDMGVGVGNCKGSLKRFLAFQAAVVRYEAVFARTIIFLARETKERMAADAVFRLPWMRLRGFMLVSSHRLFRQPENPLLGETQKPFDGGKPSKGLGLKTRIGNYHGLLSR